MEQFIHMEVIMIYFVTIMFFYHMRRFPTKQFQMTIYRQTEVMEDFEMSIAHMSLFKEYKCSSNASGAVHFTGTAPFNVMHVYI